MRGRFARSGLYTFRLCEAMRTLFVIAPAVLFLYASGVFSWAVVP
nr:MAG TPA: Lhca1, Type II chlorophyll a/b, membrane complex, chlorophyll, light [Caudoviricetes sp.]